jgi:hypothetical protein
MKSRALMEIAGVTVVVAAATWAGGWWTVPVVALIAGAVSIAPWRVALGSSLAWLALLSVNAASPAFPKLITMLSKIMGFPSLLLVALTLALSAALGWAAATLAAAARRRSFSQDSEREPTSHSQP